MYTGISIFHYIMPILGSIGNGVIMTLIHREYTCIYLIHRHRSQASCPTGTCCKVMPFNVKLELNGLQTNQTTNQVSKTNKVDNPKMLSLGKLGLNR